MSGSNMVDFVRLEEKVDRVAAAVEKLVLIEERQSTQAARIDKLEARMLANEQTADKVDRKIDQWINRGIGVWAVAAMLVTVGLAIYKS